MGRQCSLGAHDDGGSGKDPLAGSLLLRLKLEASSEDEGRSTTGGHVNGARVDSRGLLVLARDGSHVDNGKDWMELLQLLVHEVALLFTSAILPSGTFKEETIDVGTLLGEVREVLDLVSVLDFGPEADVIERKVLGTGSHLHDSREVGHGIEESRDPEHVRGLDIVGPFLQLGHSDEKLSEPFNEKLLSWVGGSSPLGRQDINLN